MRPLLLLLLFSCTINSNAQPRPVIKNIVFEGAGIRGIAYSGAIAALSAIPNGEKTGMINHIEKVAGTSAGAIVALIVSLGYTAGEIQSIIAGTDFRKFNDGQFFFPGGIHRTNKFFGWYRGIRFERWLQELIKRKTGDADISFETLHQKGFKDLYVTGTCINRQQLVVFSRHTYPQMKIRDAVRISMSIPLYFEAVFIDKMGKVVRHPKQKAGLDIMVDGGFTGNFPLHIFDSLNIPNSSTLGFRIDRDEQIQQDRSAGAIAPMEINSLKQYISALYNISIENLNRQQLTPADWKRTVSISDGRIGPRIRRLSAAEINTLVENGRSATRNFLLN
jgi:NTE family protein